MRARWSAEQWLLWQSRFCTPVTVILRFLIRSHGVKVLLVTTQSTLSANNFCSAVLHFLSLTSCTKSENHTREYLHLCFVLCPDLFDAVDRVFRQCTGNMTSILPPFVSFYYWKLVLSCALFSALPLPIKHNLLLTDFEK